MTRFRRSWPWWRWVLTGLSILALALSVTLGWHYLKGGSLVGCGGPGAPGCNQVLNSRWSTIAGVLPVSGLAAGAYLALLVAGFFIGLGTAAPVRRLAWSAMLVLAGSVAGSAVWFTIVQKWFIGAFCPYCTVTHITGLLLAVMVIWRAPKRFDGNLEHVTPTNSAPVQKVTPDAPRRIVGPLPAVGLALVGVALAGILAAFQVGFAPQTVYRDGQSQENLASIDPHSAPIVGSPDAAYVVALLFDYQCRHCQQIHFMLDEVVRRYGGKMAFALCPTPLNTRCNPHIPRDADEFKDSCELARAGLAVWLAKREAFPVFERWMFSFESGGRWLPRRLDDARVKAVELVGQSNFDAARSNPWIDHYLQTSVGIYGKTVQSGGVPKLVFGSRWVIAEPYSADDLVMILRNSLAVPTP
jgi:uncharacterized membrane protein